MSLSIRLYCLAALLGLFMLLPSAASAQTLPAVCERARQAHVNGDNSQETANMGQLCMSAPLMCSIKYASLSGTNDYERIVDKCTADTIEGKHTPESLAPSRARHSELFEKCQNGGPGAVNACSALIESSDEEPQTKALAHLYRGSAYYEAEKYKLAVDDFDQTIALNPGEEVVAMALSARGNTYSLLNREDAALNDFNNAIPVLERYRSQHQVSLIAALLGRGEAYMTKSRYDPAVTDFSEVISIDPTNELAYRLRGYSRDLRSVSNDPRHLLVDEAIDDYTQALKLNPRDMFSLFHLGLNKEIAGVDRHLPALAAEGAKEMSEARAGIPKGESLAHYVLYSF
jgi:tetratricopeptide (TPR) repeat protein